MVLCLSAEMENILPTAPEAKFISRPPILAPDAILQDRYRIVRQLGRGGMGAVYEAVDRRLNAVVALKETFSVDERLRKQFEQEAHLLAQLHHPALPRVSDYFTEGDRAFLVMQFIGGVDLAAIIASQPGPFPRNQVIAWADQLLDALIYLHTRDRQIIHRDIKPHNLKVTANGQIALLDFGLAKAQTTDLSGANSSNSIFGYTRRYSPLEQIQDQGTSPQSDIYALGATLYHLLTGVKPPDALERAAALANSKSDPLRPANEVHRAVGSEIAAILDRAMALSPEDRYPTASEFRGALSRVGRSETASTKVIADRSLAQSAGDATINTMVPRRVTGNDPFHGYSILKPADTAWLAPQQSRHPAVIAAVLAIVLTAAVGAFYAFGHGIDSKLSVLGSSKPAPKSNASATAVVRQANSDNSRAKPAVIRNVSMGPVEDVKRRPETPKRRTARVDTSRAKIPSVKPPHFSMVP
ncbi:MAG: eukaryotic-like serine/threonine-protein kinase [Blastocatellia bacterium]|nr:eukaryotic-like serine/threonine-protein kinase [Blastocatellia bacterium]